MEKLVTPVEKEAVVETKGVEVSTRKVDPELSAMKRIGNIIDDLDPRQARRVLGWALDKYIRSANEVANGLVPNAVDPNN